MLSPRPTTLPDAEESVTLAARVLACWYLPQCHPLQARPSVPGGQSCQTLYNTIYQLHQQARLWLEPSTMRANCILDLATTGEAGE